METWIKNKLEVANKLIFVKEYEEAEDVLREILETPEGKNNLLVQYRYIELATKLNKLEELKRSYISLAKDGDLPFPEDVCMAMVEQHGESIDGSEAAAKYQALMQKHGPQAALYFGIGFAMEALGNYDRAIYNYNQSIALDPHWHPSYFGLSQIYYYKNDDEKGDHYFYLFEKEAPYNVYGNFETHRKLSREFLEAKRFEQAEAAVRSLSQWWTENRGHCPPEIQIYEQLATAQIQEVKGDKHQADIKRMTARSIARNALDDKRLDEGVMYFIAKLFEEYGDFDTAFECYKKILKSANSNPAIIQKIGGQFLSLGEYKMAKELFDEAYKAHPENTEVRFAQLVSNLKLNGVNVEEYLIGRERLRQLLDHGGDRVELLALLHSLMAKFRDDPEVQGHMGDIYLRMNNTERASQHYSRMFELDHGYWKTALKYASFNIQYGDSEKALKLLEEIAKREDLEKDHHAEISWLTSNYYARKQDYSSSLTQVRKALEIDPWNVAYIVREIIDLGYTLPIPEEIPKVEEFILKLHRNEEAEINWREFDVTTFKLSEAHCYSLAYSRAKLRYLYAKGSKDTLEPLIKASCIYDSNRGVYDFLRLLNTNFDSPKIYWALGMLFKDLWQLETACMWFEQVLMYPGITSATKAQTYLELADCYTWRNQRLPKAIEYAKLAMDLGEKPATASTIIAHALLRTGQVRQAEAYLDRNATVDDFEVVYLTGLIHYRNGARQEANRVWKPLLTKQSKSLRAHNIKQEILRYYFDGAPYLKAN